MVSKILYQNFPSPNFALPKYVRTNPPPPPGTTSRHVLLHPQMHHRNLWFGKEHTLVVQTGCKLSWVKSGYSEAIAWRKVWLTKQQNVDLTTDGLWAMPLNTWWVPVKARRLQDCQKLKKYVPIHKQGGVCPNGVPALVEDNDDDSDSE